MTNLEAAKAAIGANYPWTDNAFELGLAKQGLNPTDTVVPGKSFDLAMAALILYLITAADIREGGYAVSLDRDAMLEARKALLAPWDEPDGTGPYLRDRTYMW